MHFINHHKFLAQVAVIWLALSSSSLAQQLQLNYYSDHYCNNYQASLKYYWSDSMTNPNGWNCYNYSYGTSVGIANCWAGSFCICLGFYVNDCQGDYTTLQYNGFDRNQHWEYNCRFNAASIKSLRCYHFA